MKFNEKLNKPQWVKFTGDESVEILIKPLSVYDFPRLPSGDSEMTAREYGELICNLIVEWKGIYSDNDTLMECTKENKLFVCDCAQDLATFVINKATELRQQVRVDDKVIKN